jgi:hypothetical protein
MRASGRCASRRCNVKVNWSKAACKGVDPELFFDDEMTADAQAYCTSCPIKVECQAHAYESESYGVWGGTSEKERKRLTRKQDRVKCPGCGGTDHLDDGNYTVCFSCGITWRNLE